MALTRKFLTGIGIEADKVDAIIEAHTEVVDGLKAKISEFGDRADELAEVRAQLEQAKNDLKTAQETISNAEKDDYKGKYESEKAAHEKLQSEIKAEKAAAQREKALTQAAKAAKYSDEAISLILDSKQDYAARIEFDEEGKPTNIDDVMGAIAADKPNLTPKITEKHHNPATPLKTTGGKPKMSKSEIMAIKDDSERQQAIKDNLDAFGVNVSTNE